MKTRARIGGARVTLTRECGGTWMWSADTTTGAVAVMGARSLADAIASAQGALGQDVGMVRHTERGE